MKYSQLNYNDNKTTKLITLANYTVKQLEEMEEKGKFTCSGEKCTAAMCLVHNTKNGGRTCYFKATDDNAHSETCQFKIKNYKAHISMLKKTGGFFTSGQINDAVRRIYKEYTEPLDKKDVKRKRKKVHIVVRKNQMIMMAKRENYMQMEVSLYTVKMMAMELKEE